MAFKSDVSFDYTPFSVVIYKATRGCFVQKSNLALSTAITEATALYEYARAFSKASMLASGVAIIVLPDEYASRIDKAGIIYLDVKQVQFQAGSA